MTVRSGRIGPLHLARATTQRLQNGVRYYAPRVLGLQHPADVAGPSYETLRGYMSRYTTEHLVGDTPAHFQRTLFELLQLSSHRMEGYADPSHQRDLSIRFHWGHDHDFGAFKLSGRMTDRHLRLLATFIDNFHALPLDLTGKHVLDVGCWTGGTSLLMAAMGAHVFAIEEVRKYADTVSYLKGAFGVSNLEVRNLSLYECVGDEFQNRFDYVLFAGVLYHITDPVLGLRLVFNMLKDGGYCLLETAAIPGVEPRLRYEGPTRLWGGEREALSRSGWNWFIPSTSALVSMLGDVGFQFVRAPKRITSASRQFAVARRSSHVDMLRAGLSRRDVR